MVNESSAQYWEASISMSWADTTVATGGRLRGSGAGMALLASAGASAWLGTGSASGRNMRKMPAASG